MSEQSREYYPCWKSLREENVPVDPSEANFPNFEGQEACDNPVSERSSAIFEEKDKYATSLGGRGKQNKLGSKNSDSITVRSEQICSLKVQGREASLSQVLP